MSKISVLKCPTADNRTYDGVITQEILRESTINHIDDVSNGMTWFTDRCAVAADRHDHTKLDREGLTQFTEDFNNLKGGAEFTNGKWYQRHISEERHHLTERVPEDVDLVDVLEHIVDSVVAAMARKGEMTYGVNIPSEVLQLAVANTVKKMLKDVVVDE